MTRSLLFIHVLVNDVCTGMKVTENYTENSNPSISLKCS